MNPFTLAGFQEEIEFIKTAISEKWLVKRLKSGITKRHAEKGSIKDGMRSSRRMKHNIGRRYIPDHDAKAASHRVVGNAARVGKDKVKRTAFEAYSRMVAGETPFPKGMSKGKKALIGAAVAAPVLAAGAYAAHKKHKEKAL